jgi:TonB-dependent SusC/RagA subfamily outer membrane receptor
MKKVVLFTGGLFLALLLSGQNRVVHGTLTAFNTYPVQHVEVSSKKAKSSVVTDSLGRFSLVCLENDIVKIKPKAFRAVSRRVGPEIDSLNINLIFMDTRKNRELAVGYGYMDESELLYAVTNLQQENNEFCDYNNIYDIISGRFAGVVVEGGAIYIRGRSSINSGNEALYVLDGVIVNDIGWITPCDIKSINVMKDGGAAIYGSRGSNGIVIIETKRGPE